nr:MAG TPA: hypothetical protein [Caudoviricetes sp.]
MMFLTYWRRLINLKELMKYFGLIYNLMIKRRSLI